MLSSYRRPLEPGKNWPRAIYSAVMLQMLEDLQRSRTEHQLNAVRWFSREPYEVAIVCAVCGLKPRQVYREVARRLREVRAQSRGVTFIRWQLRQGTQLDQIIVMPLS
jgi:hypothetical protein